MISGSGGVSYFKCFIHARVLGSKVKSQLRVCKSKGVYGKRKHFRLILFLPCADKIFFWGKANSRTEK